MWFFNSPPLQYSITKQDLLSMSNTSIRSTMLRWCSPLRMLTSENKRFTSSGLMIRFRSMNFIATSWLVILFLYRETEPNPPWPSFFISLNMAIVEFLMNFSPCEMNKGSALLMYSRSSSDNSSPRRSSSLHFL